MRKIALSMSMAAITLLAVSCVADSQFTADYSCPEGTFYAMLHALQAGDVATARQCTLYGEYVDWNAVMSEVKANPDKYRVKKIIYTDPAPASFTSSMLYYQSKESGDPNKYIVEFTRIQDKWYWGHKESGGVATLLEQKNEQHTVGQPPGGAGNNAPGNNGGGNQP